MVEPPFYSAGKHDDCARSRMGNFHCGSIEIRACLALFLIYKYYFKIYPLLSFRALGYAIPTSECENRVSRKFSLLQFESGGCIFHISNICNPYYLMWLNSDYTKSFQTIPKTLTVFVSDFSLTLLKTTFYSISKACHSS
jgi:hypothetical protein